MAALLLGEEIFDGENQRLKTQRLNDRRAPCGLLPSFEKAAEEAAAAAGTRGISIQ
jgi:hypothetical protein